MRGRSSTLARAPALMSQPTATSSLLSRPASCERSAPPAPRAASTGTQRRCRCLTTRSMRRWRCSSLHHWKDWRAGVDELRRVARTRIVIFTYDPAFAGSWWLKRDYLSKLVALDIARFPTIAEQAAAAGEDTAIEAVPIPHDCADGFLGADWRRPRAYLDPDIRAGISPTFLPPGADALLGGLDPPPRPRRWPVEAAQPRHPRPPCSSTSATGYS